MCREVFNKMTEKKKGDDKQKDEPAFKKTQRGEKIKYTFGDVGRRK
jgi:hypothetical protein